MKTMTKLNIPVKTVILAAAAIALVLVYLLQTVITPNRNTIDIPAVDGDITRIEIQTADEALTIERDGENWFVGDERYPGDVAIVDALVDAALAIDDVDVISERGGDDRFGFGDDNRRTLVLATDQGPALAFEFGAAASAGDAIYGRVQDEPAVVLLPGSLETRVRLDAAYYRDKVIARFERDSIASVRLEIAGEPVVELRRVAADAAGDEAELSETELLERDWEVRIDGVVVAAPVDEADNSDNGGTDWIPGYLRQNFFQEVAALRAERFPEEDPPGEPFARLTVAITGGGEEEIAIYPPDENVQYPLITSASPYAASMPEFRVRRLLLGRVEILEQFRD